MWPQTYLPVFLNNTSTPHYQKMSLMAYFTPDYQCSKNRFNIQGSLFWIYNGSLSFDEALESFINAEAVLSSFLTYIFCWKKKFSSEFFLPLLSGHCSKYMFIKKSFLWLAPKEILNFPFNSLLFFWLFILQWQFCLMSIITDKVSHHVSKENGKIALDIWSSAVHNHNEEELETEKKRKEAT